MAVIADSIFEGVVDRIAKQFDLMYDAMVLATGQGGGYHYTRITASDDYDVEQELGADLYDLDNTDLTYSVALVPTFRDAINALENHVRAQGYTSLDGFLTDESLHVSSEFADIYYYVKNTRLSANNVFPPVVEMGRFQVIAAASGLFTDGSALGTGSGSYDGSHYAAAEIEAYIPSGVTIGSVDLHITLNCVEPDGDPAINIVIPALSTYGDTVSIGSGVYLDITSASFTTPDSPTTVGSTGDDVKFRSKVERVIGL